MRGLVADLGPRTRRAALVVFLVTLIAGLVVPGAGALWGEQRAASVTVRTGSWVDYTRPGWAMPLNLELEQTHYDGFWINHTIGIRWSQRNPADRKLPVTYRVAVEPLDHNGTVRSVGEVTTQGAWSSAEAVVHRRLTKVTQFRITVTPVIAGVPGEPTSAVFTAKMWGESETN